MNKNIRVLRPALIASLVVFILAFSLARMPSGGDYGAGYFALSLVTGIMTAVMVFLIVCAWQGARRYWIKPGEDESPTKAKPSLFPAMVSDEDALGEIRVYGWIIVVISGISFAIRLFAGNNWLGMLDAVLVIGLVVIVFRLKSRVAAVGLLLLSVISLFSTGHTRFFGGEGGANLFLVFFLVLASVRLVIATFHLRSNRTSEPKIASPGSIATQVIANPKEELASAMNMANTTPSERKAPLQTAVDEDHVYAEIAKELETGVVDKGLWTRLFADCDGDEKKTKVLYIKQRAERLIAAESLRLEQAARERAAEAERLEKLRPPPSETQIMEEHRITFDGERYAYREYKYDRLSDAISYANLQKTRSK